MQKKIVQRVIFFVTLLLIIPGFVSAHVSVSPKEVGVGAFQTFTVSVPVEREVATVGLRLIMPEGLEHVSPTVKPGWSIAIKHGEAVGSTEVDHAGHGPVTEILWTGGNIPEGQRDDFSFSAKVPSKQTTLVWKAYQTYADGSVVAWDLGSGDEQPQKDGKPDFSTKGPVSETAVVDDLSNISEPTLAELHQQLTTEQSARRNSEISLLLSSVAFILSLWVFFRFRRTMEVEK